MRKLLIALLLCGFAASSSAQPVVAARGLEALPSIMAMAKEHRIAERFGERWKALAARLAADEKLLTPLRGLRLSGPKAHQAQAAIDDILAVDREVKALVRGDARSPAPSPPALRQPPATPASAPAAAKPKAAPSLPAASPSLSVPPTAVSAASTPLGTTISLQDLRMLQEALERTQQDLTRTETSPSDELSHVMKEIRALIGAARTPGAHVSQLEIEDSLKALRKAAKDPCEEEALKAYLARDSGDRERAYEAFSRIAERQCFDPTVLRDARDFVAQYRSSSPAVAESSVAPRPASPSPATSAVAAPAAASPKSRQSSPPAVAETPRSAPSDVPKIGLDIWQSAWRDFSDLHPLTDYIRRNSIAAVNLNPGRAVSASSMREAYAQLQPIVDSLRASGVKEINYLYAELSYPIGAYAEFLKAYPALGITTIVDDSEFTDDKRGQFENNLRTVRATGLHYSAFITLEVVGNSGVSDEMRFWAVEHIDQPILMSYFGCSFPEQREQIEKYLVFADRIGRVGAVRVAILLGNKSVGRERSCEQQLAPAEFHRFLGELHSWAQQHPSYGGIVLETNLRLPTIDVIAQPR
jgi:hypothetical protein